MNEKDIFNKLEYIQIDVEKLLELCETITEKYLAYNIDCEGLKVSHPNEKNSLRAFEFCQNNRTIATLFDITDDYIRKILSNITEILNIKE